ncbi:hypothetical protein GCM10009641_86700 [Mycobacterium cookii]
MNTHAPYQRRLGRALPEPMPTAVPDPAPNALVLHGDPSLLQPIQSAAEPVRPTITWVRPSEVSTLIGARWAGRGINLQDELTRRARRVPAAAATKAARRLPHPVQGQSLPSATTATPPEGLGL